jgi:hypothetical protein
MNCPFVLPDAESVPIRCEADYYGASRLIAEALGLSEPPVSRSSWVHGCDMFPMPREVFSPHFNVPEQTHLVGNQTAAKWWQANGFRKAVAVGCPFVYTRPSGLPKIPGSVLAMPNHSLPGCSRDRQHVVTWLRMIDSIKNGFTSVTVCLHADDVEELLPLVTQAGLQWIVGAKHNTASLPRMRALFDQCEFMFTDVQGSHVPYAAWCDCKVALLPPIYVREWEFMASHPHSKNYPQTRKNLAFHEPDFIRQRLPFLFVERPEQAICPKEWAAELLGASCAREPETLARLLGWRADDPALEGEVYEKVAASFGAVSPDKEIQALNAKVAELREKMRSERAAHQQTTKQFTKLNKVAQRQQVYLDSISSKFAKRLFSIEKRLRGLFARK